MTDYQNDNRITGKQVLFDAVTLFKDAGAYIYELGKVAVVKIKNMIQTANAENTDETGDK